jgi:hypothetical protein
MHDRDQRIESRFDVIDLCWPVRSEVSQTVVPMQVENLSRGGACLRLRRRSARADEMLRAALSAPYLLEVAESPFGRPRMALVRWHTSADDGRSRLGLEWIEPLERLLLLACPDPLRSRRIESE